LVVEIIQQLCEWKKLEVLEKNVQLDHIHLKKRYWGRHFWTKGYCVSTVGLDEEKILRYVNWHIEKDKRIEQENLWKEN